MPPPGGDVGLGRGGSVGPKAAPDSDSPRPLRTWDFRPAAPGDDPLPAGTIAAAAFAPDRLVPAITGRITDEEWRAGIARHLTPRCGSAVRAARLVRQWSDPIGRVDGDVFELLALARRSIPVALVSNATVDDTPENVRGAEALGMAGLVYHDAADLRRALELVLD